MYVNAQASIRDRPLTRTSPGKTNPKDAASHCHDDPRWGGRLATLRGHPSKSSRPPTLRLDKPSVITDSSQAFTTQALRRQSPCRNQSGNARRISAFKAVTLPRAPQGGHHRQQPPGHGYNRPLGTTTLLEIFVDPSPPDTTPCLLYTSDAADE